MFIEEFLQDLRRDRFTPRALLVYGRRVLQRIREDLDANPVAVRSVWSAALGFFAATFLAAAGMAVAFDRHLAYDFFVLTTLFIIVSFGFVTLLIGMLRDTEGYRLPALNLPLLLTLLRTALIPGIALLLVERHFGLALGTFVFAALTDVADGWIARSWKQITRLGTVLDPVVDIVFNFTVFGALWASHLVPLWVFGVAALRYALLLVGGSCLYVFVGPVRIQPTVFGRMSGVVMATLIGFLALLHAIGGAWAETLAPLTEIALGVLMAMTVAQVVALGWYNLRVMKGKAQAHGRVVGDVRWGAS